MHVLLIGGLYWFTLKLDLADTYMQRTNCSHPGDHILSLGAC